MSLRTAVVLFNLGGPDGPASIRPFLLNLFSDPAILRVPGFIRYFLARYISHRRTPAAEKIYAEMGGSSPILAQTRAQASALEREIGEPQTRVFVCMRYWQPMSPEVAEEVRAFAPEKIVLLPLYPQFSTSTTESSFRDWDKAAENAGIDAKTVRICCYPTGAGFIAALAQNLREGLQLVSSDRPCRVVFSAHGIPESFVADGDPYQAQIEQTVSSVVERLGVDDLDYVIAYQSRVGRLAWLRPYLEDEIIRGGADAVSLVVVPVAFVSEHSETLVELDIEYAELARSQGVADYVRVATVGSSQEFIASLAALVGRACESPVPLLGGETLRSCPEGLSACPRLGETALEAR